MYYVKLNDLLCNQGEHVLALLKDGQVINGNLRVPNNGDLKEINYQKYKQRFLNLTETDGRQGLNPIFIELNLKRVARSMRKERVLYIGMYKVYHADIKEIVVCNYEEYVEALSSKDNVFTTIKEKAIVRGIALGKQFCF